MIITKFFFETVFAKEGNPNPEFDTGFDDVDQNGDGVVDPAEYEAADDDDDDGNNN